MNPSLWKGTPLVDLALSMQDDARLRLAYHVGQIEFRLFELMGVLPDDDEMPEEARRVARLLVNSLLNPPEVLTQIEHAIAIELAAWQRRHN